MHQYFASSAATTQFSNSSLPLVPKTYDFSINANSEIEGSSFETDAQGRVIGAQYASGAVVKMNETCMIVRSEDWSLWFADSQKHFHPID